MINGDEIIKAMEWPRRIDELEGRVLYALRSYQMIEAVLKSYIHRVIQGHIPGKSLVGEEIERVNKLPMGKLIVRFKKVSDNHDLIELLEKVESERNRVAHQALVSSSPELAKMIGAELMTLEEIRNVDHLAAKVSTKMVCEYIESFRSARDGA